MTARSSASGAAWTSVRNGSAPCPACGSMHVARCEEVSLDTLARVWSRSEPGSGDELLALRDRGEIPATVAIARCEACALEYGDPMFSVGSDWYSRFERYGPRWEFFEVMDRLAGQREAILEVGCGAGLFLELAARAGHHAVGLDFNEQAVTRARAKGLDARVGDLRSLADGTRFSVIVMFHVIEHVEEPRRLLADVRRCADDAAKLFVSCPGPHRFTTELLPAQRAGNRDMWDYPPFHQTRWSATAFARAFEASGWRLGQIAEEPIGALALNATLCWERPAFQRAGWLGRKALLAASLPANVIRARRYKGMSILATAMAS